jgi:metal-dependent amidase/aminoacylase/carboxypeptidase family protein
MPHLGRDAVLMGSQFVVDAQSIIPNMINADEMETFVVANFQAGNGAKNVIADTA